jgi:PEP-CTERM motif-containing protein
MAQLTHIDEWRMFVSSTSRLAPGDAAKSYIRPPKIQRPIRDKDPRLTTTSQGSPRNLATFVLLSILLFLSGNAWGLSVPYNVIVNTTPLVGSGAQLAFDFIDGGAPANTVTISDFATNGILGSFTTIGSVTGNLPGTLTLADRLIIGGSSFPSFFNEYLHNITLGTTLSFLLDATTNGPSGASSPDSFSFFLLNPITNLSLVSTSDPTGSNALFVLDTDGSPQGLLSVYSVSGGQTSAAVTAVPEPRSLLLMLFGLAGLIGWRRVRHNI